MFLISKLSSLLDTGAYYLWELGSQISAKQNSRNSFFISTFWGGKMSVKNIFETSLYFIKHSMHLLLLQI